MYQSKRCEQAGYPNPSPRNRSLGRLALRRIDLYSSRHAYERQLKSVSRRSNGPRDPGLEFSAKS